MRVIYYDGLCGLCDRAVQFVLPRDRQGRYHFAPLQGTTAQSRFPDQTDLADSSTFILDDEGTVRVRSDAALAVLTGLGGIWRAAAILRVVPRPIRDAVYNWVARHRRQWFGRLDECRVPSVHERERFLP